MHSMFICANPQKKMKTPSALDEAFANGPFNLTSEEYFDNYHHSCCESEGDRSADNKVDKSLQNSSVKNEASNNATNIVVKSTKIDVQLNTDSPEVIAAQMAEAKRAADIALKQSVVSSTGDLLLQR